MSVNPSTVSLLLGEPQKFTATVSNSTNTAVTWTVNGTPAGYAVAGTIDANGVYTAPADLPLPASVSVQATSVADPSKSSTSIVTLQSDVSVSISPGAAPVELGAAQPFTATVSSSGNPNRSVLWDLAGRGGSCGSLDSSGNYVAPAIQSSPASFSVMAISVADSSKSAAAAVTVTSTFSLAVAGPASLDAGATANYSTTLTPAANSNPSRAIAWSVAGVNCAATNCGSISQTGVYIAPSLLPDLGKVEIVATPLADPAKAVAVPVIILSAVSVTISPTSASILVGTTAAFQATVTGTSDPTVTWLVNGVPGGNAAAGTIVNPQSRTGGTTYTAPLNLPPGGSVTVQALSNADPSISASATVTIYSGIGVTLTPATASLVINHSRALTASVTGTANQAVTWQVNGIAGGNAAVGQICALGSSPCQPLTMSSGGSVEYLAPAGVASPNPVTITATSQADATQSASASLTILPHVLVSVQPGSVALAGTELLRFAASVIGTADQQVTWSITGPACVNPAGCGSVDSTGLFTAPVAAPSPDSIQIAATSAEDTSETGFAAVTITSGPRIFSLSPTSAYAGSLGGFTLLVSGNNFSPSSPGPGPTMLVGGSARPTSCPSVTECTTSLESADLESAGNVSVQLENPGGLLSNAQTFVVLAPSMGTGAIPLTPSSPTSSGADIVVVDLSTNGSVGPSGNVSLTVGAMGAFSALTGSCALAGSPVVIQRPAVGTSAAGVCVFSVSGLSPSFAYTVSGPPTPDIAIINRAPLGLGIVQLILQVPSTASPGPRTLFVQDEDLDLAAGTGSIEVR